MDDKQRADDHDLEDLDVDGLDAEDVKGGAPAGTSTANVGAVSAPKLGTSGLSAPGVDAMIREHQHNETLIRI